MTTLAALWARAQEEYQEFQCNREASTEPEDIFCQGYVFGVAFGLALSTECPQLVRKFAPLFRQRGWLPAEEGSPDAR